MKKWIIRIGIILIILIIGGYMVLSFYTVKFLRGELRKAAIPGMTISEISTKATHLSLKGVAYEEPFLKKKILWIAEMRIYPDLFSFLKKTLKIRKWVVLQPYAFLYRSREGELRGAWMRMDKPKGGKISIPGERIKRDSFHLEIDRLQIRRGALDVEDKTLRGTPARLSLKEVDLSLRNIRYPLIVGPSPVELKGKIWGKGKEGTIRAKGWINFETFDMEAILKVQGIEVKAFEPYYRKRVSAEIEGGLIDMEAKIVLQNRMMDATGQLELTGLRVKGSGSVFWIPAETLVTLSEKKGNRNQVKFHIRGNMDDPRFNLKEALLTQIGISFVEAFGGKIKR